MKIKTLFTLFTVLMFISVLNIQLNATDSKVVFSDLTGPYLGQKPPGNTPEVFAPGIVSNSSWAEHCQVAVSPSGDPVFSLDGSKLFFYQSYAPAVSNKITYYVEKHNGNWSNTPIEIGEPYNSFYPNWTPVFTKELLSILVELKKNIAYPYFFWKKNIRRICYERFYIKRRIKTSIKW